MDSEIYNTTIANNSNNASGNGFALIGGHGSLILKNSISGMMVVMKSKQMIWHYHGMLILNIQSLKMVLKALITKGIIQWGQRVTPQVTHFLMVIMYLYLGLRLLIQDILIPWFIDIDGSENDIGFSGGSGINAIHYRLRSWFVVGGTVENTISVHSNKNYGGIVIDK